MSGLWESITNPPKPAGLEPKIEVLETDPAKKGNHERYGSLFLTAACPQKIREHFENLGYYVNFIYDNPMNLAQESTFERFPVMAEEIPAHLKSLLSNFSPASKYNGELHRGDCVLVKQPFDAREYWHAFDEDQRLRRIAAAEEVVDRLDEATASEMSRITGRSYAPRDRVSASGATRIADHYITNKEDKLKMETEPGAPENHSSDPLLQAVAPPEPKRKPGRPKKAASG